MFMGREIDLLADYPRSPRNVDARGLAKTEMDRAIARKFGQEFFDGDRAHGYGGFSYNPRFWTPVAPTLQKHFDLKAGDSLLDVGCAKGFMMHDLKRLIPGLRVQGVDVSEYAIDNAMPDMREHVQVADAASLPFPDMSFDVVISINTIHNLARAECAQALKEIQRVARRGAFITVDAYGDEDQRRRMEAWNLTAQTIMHVDDWKAFFGECGYTGDYYWFIP
jgi:SAM-dependent methyltransferase